MNSNKEQEPYSGSPEDGDVMRTPKKDFEVMENSEDYTGYRCQHCNGPVLIDGNKSARSWKVYRCADCNSLSPLTVDDLMKEAGV